MEDFSLFLSLSSDILTYSFIHSLIYTPSSFPSKKLSTYSTQTQLKLNSTSNKNLTTLHPSSPYQTPPRWSKIIPWTLRSQVRFIYLFNRSIDRSWLTDVAGACILLLLLLLLFSTRSGVIVVYGWKRQEERDWKGEEERGWRGWRGWRRWLLFFEGKKRKKGRKDRLGETQNFVRR